MIGQVVQVTLSLAVVLALMWLAAKALRRTGVAPGAEAVELLARQPLSRNAAVAVVRVGERALVLGVAEQHVTLVAETDLAEIRAALTPPVRERRPAPPLASLLSLPGRRVVSASHSDVVGPEAAATDEDPTLVGAASAGAAQGGSGLAGSALAGSALSPATWRAAVDVLRDRTARRA